jgi:hypothetical protein
VSPSQPVSLADREVISRLRNCIVLLVTQRMMLYDTSILYCYEASLPHQVLHWASFSSLLCELLVFPQSCVLYTSAGPGLGDSPSERWTEVWVGGRGARLDYSFMTATILPVLNFSHLFNGCENSIFVLVTYSPGNLADY